MTYSARQAVNVSVDRSVEQPITTKAELEISRAGVLPFMLLVLTLTSCGAPNVTTVPCSPIGSIPIHSWPKDVSFSEQYGVATLDGRWRATTTRESPLPMPPVLNTTHVLCGKPEMVCTESIAMLRSDRQVTISELDPLLDVRTHEYQVVEWSGEVIHAVEQLPVGDLEIRISLPDKSAQRSYRETRGDLSVYDHWVLE